jgi:hypothetical protein
MMDIDVYAFSVLGAVVVLTLSLILLVRRHRGIETVQGQAATQASAETQVQTQRRGATQAEFAMAAEQAMLDLKSSVETLATCMANLELRLRSVDQRQHKMDEMSAQLLRRRGFDEALHQVRDGKSAVEVARICSLPLAEVQLLQRIHQKSATH